MHGGKITNQQGALQTVAQQPFGKVLLTLVAIGLGGYSLWRLVRAAIGHGPEGSDSGFDRLAALASGIVYGAICCGRGRDPRWGRAEAARAAQEVDRRAFSAGPRGTWIVGIAGAVMIGVALYQGYRGLTKKFLKDSKVEEMAPGVRRSGSARLGTVGHLARMVVFGLVGIFLIKAAIDYNPKQAVGLDGALAKIVDHSYGPLLLGVVAAGLIAFALYSLSDARYRRI